MTALPQELVSLVHHVQLNQNGWWQDAMDRLVVATVWQASQTITQADLAQEIRRQYSVALGTEQISRTLSRLRENGTLIFLPNGFLKISEERQLQLDREKQDGLDQEAAVRARFIVEMTTAGIADNHDHLWSQFKDKWIQPTVCSLGARTYELMIGNYQDWLSNSDLDAFLTEVDQEYHHVVTEAIGRFLDPTDSDVRGYILRHMDAYFVVEASRLSDATIEKIGHMAGTQPSFTLLLDANVLLSILGLHGTAKREAAELLLELTRQLSGRVNVKLYALPRTIDETRAALEREQEGLERLRLTRSAAAAALFSGELGDVAAAFAEATVKTGHTLRAQDFFGPYIRDLAGILRERGIQLYNAATDTLEAREDVQEDILNLEEFEKRKYGVRAKRRSQISHDVVLWHFANSKRPPRVESPTDALFWVVTEDYRLASFDAFKRRQSGIAVCVQPLSLLQILQFWAGRTEGMDEALLGGLRLSLLAPQFDSKAEKTTITILKTLSRFENVDDLPTSSIAHVLVNDALRQRLIGTADEEEQVKLVRDELFAEHKRALAERDAAAKRARELEAAHQAATLALNQAREGSTAINARLNEAERALEQRTRELAQRNLHLANQSSELEERREREREITQRMQDLEKSVEEAAEATKIRDEVDRAKKDRRDFVVKWVVLPASILLIGQWLATTVGSVVSLGWRGNVLILAAYLFVWLWLMHSSAANRANIRDWPPYQHINKMRLALYALFIIIAGGVITNLVYDELFRPLTSTQAPATVTP
jgi:hypothetical protein